MDTRSVLDAARPELVIPYVKIRCVRAEDS